MKKHTSLAAEYRPQTFADVVGQELVTTVLSRAAAKDAVAPAYLLSGTRGVGKTTIARILAKALNCVHAPAAEPCNVCEQCKKITIGHHVDVAEIDGASNNSVDDARALREHIGYAPMEGRYKIFIIDEAHMLSRNAFNALLKTLEEPPPRVVFIFATTEAHKFPITIISRCQHFIFKRVPETILEAHLTHILTQEHAPFDPQAVRLLVRRAAGSVRDGMSLLGQTLALGQEGLTLEATRNVLGLAGQDALIALFNAVADQDALRVMEILRTLLDAGVDIGFFLREIATYWRTLFLLRHAGKAALPTLEMAEDEAQPWLVLAQRFSLTHIHAAWHMVLEAQRKVIHTPEPAAALELLLLNLTLLPRLLPLENAPPITTQEITTLETTTAPKEPAVVPQAIETPPTPQQFIWEEFIAYCVAQNTSLPMHILQQARGEQDNTTLNLTTSSLAAHDMLQNHAQSIQVLATAYTGETLTLTIHKPHKAHTPEATLKQEFATRQELQPCMDILQASLLRVTPIQPNENSI